MTYCSSPIIVSSVSLSGGVCVDHASYASYTNDPYSWTELTNDHDLIRDVEVSVKDERPGGAVCTVVVTRVKWDETIVVGGNAAASDVGD